MNLINEVKTIKPPICSICNKRADSDDECTLVYFKKTPEDIEWDKKAAQPGFVGHPPYAVWFCKEHYEKVKDLTHLTKYEAFQKMEEKDK